MKRSLVRLSVLAVLAMPLLGCGIQDTTQPRENSISAGPRSDQAVVKPKKGARPSAPAGKRP